MSTQPCVDAAPLNEILARYPAAEPALIQVLQDVHRAYHYLPCDVLVKVADALHVPLAKVFSVGTFYKTFSLVPQGRTIVRVCTGTACHIRGSGRLIEELARLLKVGPGETTEDMGFTVKTVNCVGACAMAPVMIVGEKYHGGAEPAKVAKYIGETGAVHED
ncbi:MAG: NAD(P)H-dependent oxidoreductase subunit E [Thermoanaerobaculales bacterium]